MRVIHKSLMFEAVKEGEETYLAEVLKALEEKYKKKESAVKLMLAWLSSQLGCCGKTEENLDRLEQSKKKDDTKEAVANLEANRTKNSWKKTKTTHKKRGIFWKQTQTKTNERKRKTAWK